MAEKAVICILISFLASVAGAICGVGGGVIIRPVLDLFQVADLDTIHFLSGCTVLSMSGCSIAKSFFSRDKTVSIHKTIPVALGSVVGGILGKELFSFLKVLIGNENLTGIIQSACLIILTVCTLWYTLCQNYVKTKHLKNPVACFSIGLFLGITASFLGIGGGPVNLVILYYFFSMDTKTAAINSLYIIFCSQASSLLLTVCTRAIPLIQGSLLFLMTAGGVIGGMVGRHINHKISNILVNKLFVGLMMVIIAISIYNFGCGILQEVFL